MNIEFYKLGKPVNAKDTEQGKMFACDLCGATVLGENTQLHSDWHEVLRMAVMESGCL